MKLKKYYATATGLYSEKDWGGPPPMKYDIVYMASDVDKLLPKPISDDDEYPSSPQMSMGHGQS